MGELSICPPLPACQSVLPILVSRARKLQSVTREGKPGIRGQNSCARTARPELMAPPYLAGLIINGFEYTFAPDAIICTCPAEGAVVRFGEIDAVTWMSIDNK